jgi:hypothetical protein
MPTRRRDLFGPKDPSQVITRPDARTTQRLASLTATGRLPRDGSTLVPPPEVAFRNVRYPSVRPPPDLMESEPSGERARSSPASSGQQHLLALQPRPAGTGSLGVPAVPRLHWIFPVAFLMVVAAGALWLALGLRVLSW